MICNNCGAEFEDRAKFCPNCGSSLPKDEIPAPISPEIEYAPKPEFEPAVNTAPLGNPAEAKSCMIMGILAAAFSCTFIASFMGIIFGIIGMSKAKRYVRDYNVYTAKVRVGKYCSIGGLAMGIFMTILLFIYIAIIVLVIGAATKR